jgi:hypothetical protein
MLTDPKNAVLAAGLVAAFPAAAFPVGALLVTAGAISPLIKMAAANLNVTLVKIGGSPEDNARKVFGELKKLEHAK